MKDRLKEIVDERRQEFDVYEGNFDDLWPEIEKGIVRKQRNSDLKWLWRVAAALVVGVGLTMMINYFNQVNLEGDELAYMISPEWAETEQYYSVKINEKLAILQASNVEVDPLIYEDIELIDQAYKELKEDLADGADNEEVINAMITNYQIKLEILERILAEIGENEENENEEDYEL